MADGTIRVIIDPTGAVRGGRKVKTELQSIRQKMLGAQASAKVTTTAMSDFSKSLIGPIGVVVAVAAMGKALSTTIKVAAKFEAAVAELSAITGATGKDLTFLSDQAKLLGRTTTLSASEVATGFKLIASAKPDLLESGAALTEVTKNAITLAEAAGIALPDAAKALAGSLNQFQADADQAGRFINVLAAGSKRGAAEIPELTESLKAAGTVAASAGLSFEETVANIETLAEVNLKGAESGTALRNILLLLQKQGVDSLNPAVVGLTQSLENLAKEERTDVELLKVFGVRNFAAVKALLVRTDKTKLLTTAITGTLTAEEQAAINTDNLEGRTKALNSAIEGLSISIGTVLLPAVDSSVSFFTNYINVVTDALEKTIEFGTGISDTLGGAVDSNADFLRNIADKSIEEIEDRVRQENQLLNDLLAFSVSDTAAAIAGTTLGISTAFTKGDIQDAELFIAQLKRARTAKQELDAQTTGGGAPTADELAAEAAIESAKKLALAQQKAAAERKKRQEEAVKDAQRAAEEQARSFESLAASLNPLEAALTELNEAEAVLQKQQALGLVTDEEAIVLQGQLTDAFKSALDPIGALNEKLAEEQALAKLSNAERAIEARVIQEVNALKAAGIQDADAQADAIRTTVTETMRLTAAQNENKQVQEVVNEQLELQKSILEDLRGPQQDMNDRIEALNQLLADDSISLEEFNSKMMDLRAATLAGQTSVEAGFERGFISAQENLNDFASVSEKIVTESFQGMEDGIVDFAKTGKVEFAGLVDSILEDLVRLAAKKSIVSALGAPPGAEGGGSGLFGFLSKFTSSAAAPGGPPGAGGAPAGGGGAGGASGFAGLASTFAGLFASNQDGGIETQPTFSALAEKGPEAIIPLKGGKVPVEVKNQAPPAIITNTFNITTPDAGSFGRSTGQIGNMVGQSFQKAMGRNG